MFQLDIYLECIFLSFDMTGSACSSHTKSTESWLQDHLGPFVKQAPYEDLTKLLASFSAVL